MSDATAPASGQLSGRLRLVSIAAAAAIAIAIVWLLLQGGGSSGTGTASEPPTIATLADLRSLSASLGGPVYWAGPMPGTRLELSEEADGSVYVRYLGPDVEAGDPRPDFLTVGTYPVADATAALRRASHKPGARVRSIAGGALVLVDPSKPDSAYIAYPGADSQIEVYDPAPRQALRLALSGKVRAAN